MTSTATTLEVDLCIIGTGSGNSIVDEEFAGTRVAIVDAGVGPRGSFGGTCLNVGCIPTKMYVLPADHAVAPEEAARVGVRLSVERPVDLAAICERIFARIDPIADAGLAYREGQDDVTVLRGRARFLDEHTLRVGEGDEATTVRASTFVLASGSRSRWPSAPGFDDPALRGSIVVDSDEIVRQERLPRRLVILGGGVEAAEFAHVFAAYGSEVTVINRGPRLLSKIDHELADAFTALTAERMTVRLGEVAASVRPGRPDEDAAVVLTTRPAAEAGEAAPRTGNASAGDPAAGETEYRADVVLVCQGRIPNSDTLDVAAAGVDVDDRGFVVVDENQRSCRPHIWALGDVCSPWMLKHVANFEARAVRHNLLHPDDLTCAEHDVVPAAVFGHPQIATVGATEEQLKATGTDYVVKVQRYADVAYGWAMEDQHHVVKVLGEPGTGRVLGAHLMGPQASTLIQPIVQMMTLGTDTTEMVRRQYWIHPALTEVVENALLGMLQEARG